MSSNNFLKEPWKLRNLTKDEFEFLLKDFSCKRHPLVENFLRKSAWTFDERDVVRTYLWIGNEKPYLRGFITLGIRSLSLPETLSKTKRKEIFKGFRKEQNHIHSFFIGQICRADGVPKEELPLERFLKFAFEIFREINEKVGTRLITLDVAKIEGYPKLVQTYQNYGFKPLFEDSEFVVLYALIG